MALNKIDYEATKNIPIPVGVGQSWQDVLASRASGVTYTNTTGKTIAVSVTQGAATSTTMVVSVNGVTVANPTTSSNAARPHVTFLVPTGQTYSVTVTGGTLLVWAELR